MSTFHLLVASLICSGISLILAIYAVVSARHAWSWKKRFAQEEEPQNLEEIIERVTAKIKRLEIGHEKTEDALQALTTTLTTAIQYVSVVRFDSGADDGGNLSFSLALLDAHQTGVLLTSLHGRQYNRIYTKQITNGASQQILSEEEKEALIQALTGNK